MPSAEAVALGPDLQRHRLGPRTGRAGQRGPGGPLRDARPRLQQDVDQGRDQALGLGLHAHTVSGGADGVQRGRTRSGEAVRHERRYRRGVAEESGGTSGGDRQQPPPATSSRARDLSRARRPRPRSRETGRRHHIGDAPAVMSVLRPDGTVGTTRTAPIQLADRNDAQLRALAEQLAQEMAAAAAATDFEQAAHLRDEVAAARRELDRRLTRRDEQSTS